MPAYRKFWRVVRNIVLPRVWAALTITGLLAGGISVTAPTAAAKNSKAAPAAPTTTYTIFLPLVQQGTLPPEAPAQQLIAEALQAGEIDYFTSLLYRGYAQYGDGRLPAHLRGTHSGEDQGLFAEIELARPTLTPEQQALLNGFLVRPNHPDSVLKGPLPAPPAGLSAASQFGMSSPQAVAEFNCTPVGEDGTAWGSLSSTSLQVTVHSMCFNNPGLDATHIVPLVQLTVNTLDGIAEPMIDFMGVTPLLDGNVADDGGDESIDLYILYDDEVYPRGDPSVRFSNSENGFARPLRPRQGVAAPGLVGMRRSLVGSTGDTRQFRLTLAHEFFHLLQFARNEQYMGRGGESHWFVEASATWAGWFFTPDARALVHSRFDPFQNSPQSLHDPAPTGEYESSHAYAAYIWPFFMHQEVNSFTISQSWADIAGVQTWEQADAVLDSWVSFDDNFPTFALRNLNDKDKFGSALAPHYVDFDPTFPDGEEPPIIEVDHLVLPGDSQTEVVSLPSLRAKYYHYIVDPDVQRLEVDVSDMAPPEHFNAQMVAKIRGGGWQVIPLPEGEVMQFCPDVAEEDIEEFYLVLSNTDLVIDNSLEGTFTVRDLAQPCECPDFTEVNEFVGSGSLQYNYTASNSSWIYSLEHAATGTVTVTLDEATGNGSRYLGTPNGSGSINDSETDLDDNPPETETLQLAGPLMPSYQEILQAKFLLNFDWIDCRYNITIENVIQGGGGLPAHIGTAHSGWKPIPESGVLTGNIAIPSHSVLWAVSQGNAVGVYIPTSAWGAAMFVNVLGWFAQAGEAQMTWNFQAAE